MHRYGPCIVVSKGRADIAIINQSGTVLSGSGGYDDTRSGHDRLSGVLRDLRREHPEARLIAGVEATGGYERTWVAFFQRERHAGRAVAFHRLNPLAVKRYLEADLHRKVDDSRAAQGIARYLLERLRESAPAAIPLDGQVVFYRNIRGLIDQRKVVRQRFLALLSAVHPELVQYCDSGVPTWLLRVCQQYPTAELLARCQMKTLSSISHVGDAKAQRLRAAAQESTAALRGPGTAAAMCLLVDEHLHLDARIDELQRSIITMMADDPRVRLLDSIPGRAPWSAVALALEIGDPVRFTDARRLVWSPGPASTRAWTNQGTASSRGVLATAATLTCARFCSHWSWPPCTTTRSSTTLFSARSRKASPRKSPWSPEPPSSYASPTPCWSPTKPMTPSTRPTAPNLPLISGRQRAPHRPRPLPVRPQPST